MSDLERRIEALEKVNRRWRYAAVLLGSVLLIALVGGAKSADEVPDLLQARRIEVLRPDGKPGIVLEANKDKSALSIRAWAESNKDRDPTVMLEANENVSGLSVTARGNDGQRSIGLGADEESVGFAMMENKESPFLMAKGNDEGSSLALFDGREPSQKPAMIALRTQWSKEEKRGGAWVGVTKGGRMDEMRARLFMQETDAMEGSYLHLGGEKGKMATVTVNQENGKLEIWDQGSKAKWTTP
jgi:hypothetical protein